MFGWLNRNPTKRWPVVQVDRLHVDLDSKTFNGIPSVPCDVPALISLGKATGHDEYPTGHLLSYPQNGFELCLRRGQIEAVYFFTVPEYTPKMGQCKVEVSFNGRTITFEQSTTANELIEFLGDPMNAQEQEDDQYDVDWQGEGWELSCEFDREEGLRFFDVEFVLVQDDNEELVQVKPAS